MKSENAFVTELFEKYHDQLKRYCMRYVRYNARYYPLVDDCIQEAFYCPASKRCDAKSESLWMACKMLRKLFEVKISPGKTPCRNHWSKRQL